MEAAEAAEVVEVAAMARLLQLLQLLSDQLTRKPQTLQSEALMRSMDNLLR